MSRSFQHFEAYLSEFEDGALCQRRERIRRLRRRPQVDRRAREPAQLQMTCDEIGVEMGQEYMLDLERVFGGERKVMVRVALRVNDGRRACLLVSNNVRSVRQTRQIELL